jgi:3-phosphoshikimate 1-carboxyvinyltransferase
MATIKIHPKKLSGAIKVPPSKSHTLRAILFATLAHGKSIIRDYLHSPDTEAMLAAVQQLGAQIERTPTTLTIIGGPLRPPEKIIDCGQSGQVLRFIGALCSLLPSTTIFTDPNRPIKPLLSAINQLGGHTTEKPITIRGPIKPGKATLDGADSQPISAMLMAGIFCPLELEVTTPGEKPWIQLTLSWFDRLGLKYENHNFSHYKTYPGTIHPFDYTVPGDFSSAAFPIAAGLEVTNLDFNDVQGDKAVIPLLKNLPSRIDVNPFIDALPILATVACFASQKTEIVGGAIARQKESDRIRCIATELKKMGANIEEHPDGLTIYPSTLRGAELYAHNDHRIAMALTIAALNADSESTLHGTECVAKSYPNFFGSLGI